LLVKGGKRNRTTAGAREDARQHFEVGNTIDDNKI